MSLRHLHTLVRFLLGAYLLFMGLSKAMDPVNFLKLLREYHLLASPFPLNVVAAWLPWVEVVCGLFLLVPVALRGTALVVAGMFLFFSSVILLRALELQSAQEISFCAVYFDCGCGVGVVNACRKIGENTLWFLLALWLMCSSHSSRKLFPWR
jgi:uncharacterized membrane protein YphA (DoxX/SURF4 family)